jgi:hypothetical protein
MIGFLSAALVIIILIAGLLGSAILAFLCVLAGKGNRAAIWLLGALVFSSILFLTLAEVIP